MATVLVVDDDVEIRSSIRRTLEAEGYEVTVAGNGREALDLLHDPDRRPSVVLLDLMMPVMNGWQVLDIVARDRAFREIPVIMMSAFFGGRFIGDPYTTLVKPFAVDRLLELVAHHSREKTETTPKESESVSG